MKKVRSFFGVAIFALLCMRIAAQTDTLHLNYHYSHVEPHDSTEARIDAWIKSLKGQHVELDIVAYYHKGDFKKYAGERADELFLVLNRKARSLFTIKEVGTKKGKDWQRTMVDIVYKKVGGSTDNSAIAKKDKSENKEDDKKTAEKPAGKTVAAGTEEKEAPVAKAKSNNSEQKGDDSKKSSDTKTAGKKTEKSEDQKNKKETAVAKGEEKSTGESPAKEEEPERQKPKAASFKSKGPFVAAEQFSQRQLMVVLLDEAGGSVAKAHNQTIRKAFDSYWKETSVGFITEDKLDDASPADAMGWVLLLPGKAEMEGVPFMTYQATMLYADEGDASKSERTVKVSLRDEVPHEGDYQLLMYKLKVLFDMQKEFNREQLEETLAKKTLLVDKSMTDMSEGDFKEGYPFPFQFKESAEVSGMVKKRDANTLYLKTDVYDGQVNLMIVDASNGAILSRSPMSRSNRGSGNSGFEGSSSLDFNSKAIEYKKCEACAKSGADIFQKHLADAKVKKAAVKYLASEKRQLKDVYPLTIY